MAKVNTVESASVIAVQNMEQWLALKEIEMQICHFLILYKGSLFIEYLKTKMHPQLPYIYF